MARKPKVVKSGSVDGTAAKYLAEAQGSATKQGLLDYMAKQGTTWQENTVAAFGSRIKAAAVDTIATIEALKADKAKVSAAAKSAGKTEKELISQMDSRIAFWRNVQTGQVAAFPKEARQGRTAQTDEERLLALL